MTRAWPFALGLALAIVSPASAKPPEIRSVNLRGLHIGGTTVVTIDGADLLPAPQFFLDATRLNATIDAASTPARLIVSMPLDATTQSGIASLRLATAEGISNRVLMGLDPFPQTPLAAEIPALPAALHGTVPGSGQSRTAFTGKAGEEVIVEVDARRLGSKLRPVVHLFDSRGLQVAWGSPSQSLAGDTRVVVKLPRDDRYTITVHDTQYAPPGPSYFRLRVGRWQFADFSFPLAVARNQPFDVELLGNAGGLKVPFAANLPTDLAPLPLPAGTAGLPPTIRISPIAELVETVAADGQPMILPAAPVGVSGRLNAAGQRDRYRLPVTAGAKLVLEVFAERYGSRVDAAVEVRNAQNGLLAAIDDSPTSTDPRLEFTVPAGLDGLEIVVRDSLYRAGDDAVYRLVVAPADALPRDIEVSLRTDTLNVPAGETLVLEATATRQNYAGPIQFQVEGLPAGLSVLGTEIAAGTSGTLLAFTNSGETPGSSVIKLVAKSPDGSLIEPVRVQQSPDDRTPDWLHESVGIAAAPKTAPFTLAWANESGLPQLVLASKTAVPVKIVRPPATYGPVRLSIVSSQRPPTVNGQPNLPQTVRVEQAVEVPVNPAVKAAGDALAAIDKQHVEAVKVAQAAQGDAKVAADAKVAELTQKKTEADAALRDAEAKAMYQADIALIVPSSLTEASCDLSLRAELLNPERNVVLRTAWSPIRRLAVLNPLLIKLASNSIEAPFDAASGATIKVSAAIERLAGYKGDVALAVTGLPAGVSAANVAVKADQAEAAIEIKVPANFAGNEIRGVRLAATGPPDPLSGNLPVKATEVELVITVKR